MTPVWPRRVGSRIDLCQAGRGAWGLGRNGAEGRAAWGLGQNGAEGPGARVGFGRGSLEAQMIARIAKGWAHLLPKSHALCATRALARPLLRVTPGRSRPRRLSAIRRARPGA